MTGYHDRYEFPANCFNAANHWLLGWFPQRRHIITNPSASAQLVKLAPFVDYSALPYGTDFKILLSIPSQRLFAQFNRAKLYNVDSLDHKDKFVIVRDHGDGTQVQAALGPGEQYGNLVEVCDWVKDSVPEHLVVSVGSNTASACSSYWAEKSAATSQQQSDGSCRTSMVPCQNDAECCSRKCTASAIPGRSICAASLDSLSRERATPGRNPDENRNRGN